MLKLRGVHSENPHQLFIFTIHLLNLNLNMKALLKASGFVLSFLLVSPPRPSRALC